MRMLAYGLISLGFLAGSLVSVQTKADQIHWEHYGPALVLGLVGAVLARLARHRASRQSDALRRGADNLMGSLDRIVQNMVKLDALKRQLHPSEVPGWIDRTFRPDLDAFVEARESMVHLYGLQVYACVMNEFAAGERYLNRVWSASVDGYVDEVSTYVTRARLQFERAREELQRVSG